MTTSFGMNRFALLLSASLLLVGCFDLSVKDYTPPVEAAPGGAAGQSGALGSSESSSAGAGGSESRSSDDGGLGSGGATTGDAANGGRTLATGGGGGAESSATRTGPVINTGGLVPFGGALGGVVGSGGGSTSSVALTCSRPPGKEPVLCDFEHLKLNETMGSYECQAGPGMNITFRAGPGISGNSDVSPSQSEVHSGTTALGYSITAKGTATLRSGSLFVNFAVPADPNTPTSGPPVYNSRPCVDLSAYTGLSFWVKGTAASFAMTFFEQTGDSSSSTYVYRFTPNKDWTWSSQTVRWTDLVDSSAAASGAGFHPERLNFVTFGIAVPLQLDIELFLDDLSFTTD